MLSVANAMNLHTGFDGWRGYLFAGLVTAVATLIGAFLVLHIALTNVAMVYLLGVTYVASHSTPRAAVLASVLGVAAFDFCFVPPRWTFAVSDVEYVFTFGVMLVVGILISTLSGQLRERSRARDAAEIRAEVEAMRGDLLSSVSHDLRTPLSAIEGSADALLRQPELTDHGRVLAANIHEESKRMSLLIGNLLDMTRVTGQVDLDIDWHSLEDIAANAISRTEQELDNPISLTVASDAALVQIDGILFEQAIVNILQNAVRHAGKSAKVAVEIERNIGAVILKFMDNGPGLTPGEVERIFERFQGGQRKGLGLGLAICRAIVEAHGGTIIAANNDQGGALFTISIPQPPPGSAP